MAVAAVLIGCEPYRNAPEEEPIVMTEEQLVQGRQIFLQFCQSCHPDGAAGIGPRLAGRPIPASIVEHRVRNGRRAMPAFGRDLISDEELEVLVGYVVSLR